MCKAQLPRQINVLQLAQQGVKLAGTLSLKSMTRLVSSLSDDSGAVAFELQFGIDEEGIRRIKGKLATQVSVVCQRCLQPMEYDIDDELALGAILSHTQAQTLPQHYEPLLVTGEMQALLPIIEDELIVRLPMVATHANKVCKLKMIKTTLKTDNSKCNPFAKLSKFESH